jgi:hypothetical protein
LCNIGSLKHTKALNNVHLTKKKGHATNGEMREKTSTHNNSRSKTCGRAVWFRE